MTGPGASMTPVAATASCSTAKRRARSVSQWIKEQPGVESLRLVRDINEPVKFISFANWEGIEPIRAWKATSEFKERIGRVKQHTDDFTAAEAEVVVRINAAASVT